MILSPQGLDSCLTQLLPEKMLGFEKPSLKQLVVYRSFLGGVERVIEAFELKQFHEFDALVGENACEIRAVRTSLIAFRFLDLFVKFKHILREVKKDLNEHIELGILGESLKTFDIIISAPQKFLIECWFLTQARNVKQIDAASLSYIKEKVAPSLLKAVLPDWNSSLCDAFVKKLRINLSTQSVKFIKEVVAYFDDKELAQNVSDDKVVLHKNCWPSLPMFWTYKSLLETARREGIPLQMVGRFAKGESVVLSFVPGEKVMSYVPVEEIEEGRPVVVVQGVCVGEIALDEWKKKISENPVRVILAGAADHRQYPDPNVEVKGDTAERLEYKRIALEEGYCLSNPKVFFIQHVYASTAQKAVK